MTREEARGLRIGHIVSFTNDDDTKWYATVTKITDERRTICMTVLVDYATEGVKYSVGEYTCRSVDAMVNYATLHEDDSIG